MPRTRLLVLLLSAFTPALSFQDASTQHCAASAKIAPLEGVPGSFRIETRHGVVFARWPAPASARDGNRAQALYVIEALADTWDADRNAVTVIDTLTVPKGSTVRWQLVSGIHTITNGRDSADPEAATKFSYLLEQSRPTFDSTFTDSTLLDFFCFFHEPRMVGRLIVTNQGGPPPGPEPGPTPQAHAQFSKSPTPNPARGSMSFAINLPSAAQVDVGVFDLAGRRVATLYSGPLGLGEHSFGWDGRMDGGGRAPAARYEVRLRAGSARDGRSFSLIR